MKKCKSCQSEIDPKAIKCPKCGSDQRNWMKRHPIITGIIVVLVVLFGLGVASGGNKNSSSTVQNTQSGSNSGTTPQPTVSQTPIVIDATALVAEYDKNKLAAQDKYTGKVVQTTAYITNISSDITGNYYLSLNPSNDKYYFGTHIQCFFADKSVLTTLANGQQVTIQGTMEDMSLGIVGMKDCSLVK